MTVKLGYLTFDCANPKLLAAFWSQALGYENKGGDDLWGLIKDPNGVGTPFLFQHVPEAKIAKNRFHMDLMTDDRPAEVERLTGLGATSHETHEEGGTVFTVMTDPEGNEFCVCQL